MYQAGGDYKQQRCHQAAASDPGAAALFIETVWFRVLVLAVMAILIYLLAGWRIRGLQKRSEMLEEKIQQRTIELNRTVSDLERSQQDLSAHQVKTDHLHGIA